MNWTKVCSLQQIPPLGSRVLETESGRIAIFRNSKDDVFALQDCCYHRGGPLSQGIVHGKTVTCPLHNKVTDLDTGHAQAPEKGCTKSYPISLIDGDIFVALDEGQENIEKNNELFSDASA